MMKINRLLLLSAMLLLVGCEQSSGLPQDFDRSGQELRVTVIFHDNLIDLQSSYEKQFGTYVDDQHGYAVWKNPGQQPYTCEIHTIKPKTDGDDDMMSLGHEMTHCLFGSFHK